jgi:Tol biopolymer transport system component
MRTIAIALALSTMLTVEQRDSRRRPADPPSAAVSADGRYIAFTTFSQLAPADLDERRDVYVLDRINHRVTLESLPLTGHASDSSHPAISGDGHVVVYEDGATIAVRDRQDNSTRSLGLGRQPSISLDGRIVAFTSDNLKDVYMWERHADKPVPLFLGPGITPSLSGDGRYVAFSARASVFVHDRQTRTTERIADGWDPCITADGRYVAYVSSIGKMHAVLLMDRVVGAARVISGSRKGGAANGASVNPAISSNGRLVAFQSEASNLVDGEDLNLLWDVFVFDLNGGVMVRVSGDPDGEWMEPSGGPALDAAGEVIAFSSRHPTDASDNKNDFDLYVAGFAAFWQPGPQGAVRRDREHRESRGAQLLKKRATALSNRRPLFPVPLRVSLEDIPN